MIINIVKSYSIATIIDQGAVSFGKGWQNSRKMVRKTGEGVQKLREN